MILVKDRGACWCDQGQLSFPLIYDENYYYIVRVRVKVKV